MKYVTCCEEKKGKKRRNVVNIDLICERRGNESQIRKVHQYNYRRIHQNGSSCSKEMHRWQDQ